MLWIMLMGARSSQGLKWPNDQSCNELASMSGVSLSSCIICMIRYLTIG
jgi:hypothetical protein